MVEGAGSRRIVWRFESPRRNNPQRLHLGFEPRPHPFRIIRVRPHLARRASTASAIRLQHRQRGLRVHRPDPHGRALLSAHLQRFLRLAHDLGLQPHVTLVQRLPEAGAELRVLPPPLVHAIFRHPDRARGGGRVAARREVIQEFLPPLLGEEPALGLRLARSLRRPPLHAPALAAGNLVLAHTPPPRSVNQIGSYLSR